MKAFFTFILLKSLVDGYFHDFNGLQSRPIGANMNFNETRPGRNGKTQESQ